MMSRFLSLDPYFTKNKAFTNFTIFFFNYANILGYQYFTHWHCNQWLILKIMGFHNQIRSHMKLLVLTVATCLEWT